MWDRLVVATVVLKVLWEGFVTESQTWMLWDARVRLRWGVWFSWALFLGGVLRGCRVLPAGRVHRMAWGRLADGGVGTAWSPDWVSFCVTALRRGVHVPGWSTFLRTRCVQPVQRL